jgi:hypothetical protein
VASCVSVGVEVLAPGAVVAAWVVVSAVACELPDEHPATTTASETTSALSARPGCRRGVVTVVTLIAVQPVGQRFP